MDIDYSQQIEYDFDDSRPEPFTYLPEFDENLEDLDFIFPFNSFLTFDQSSFDGSLLVIINEKELVNIKFTANFYNKAPLRYKKLSKFTSISGQEIISSQEFTYIHDKKGNLYRFKSSKSLEKTKYENVLFLKCFNFVENCCYIMISIVNSKVVLYMYDNSFDDEYSRYLRCVDLILPEDAIPSLENEFTFEKMKENFLFASEMLSNVIENDLDIEFFNQFLNIDVKEENIRDILLLSMNDRLFYIKYRGALEGNSEMSERSEDLISIDPVIISRGKIKDMKYLDSSLIILDNFWVLSIFYQCVVTNIIKRREFPLGDGISCHRFTKSLFIYSNRFKIVFMKFRLAPSEPEIFEVDLRMVATFSVAKNEEFLIAIDRNKFFYYVPIPKYSNEPKESQEEYTKLTNQDIKKYPKIVKHLENIEGEIKELSEAVQHESDMLLFLTYLEKNKNVTAGQVKVKYVPFLTSPQLDDIVCDPVNAQSGHSYIRLTISLEHIFNAFKFTIAFYRHTKNHGKLVRHIEISPRNEKTNFAIYVPHEINDCGIENKLEVVALLYINKSDECQVLQFPFELTSTKVSSGYQKHNNIEVEQCIKSLNKLLQDDRI